MVTKFETRDVSKGISFRGHGQIKKYFIFQFKRKNFRAK